MEKFCSSVCPSILPLPSPHLSLTPGLASPLCSSSLSPSLLPWPPPCPCLAQPLSLSSRPISLLLCLAVSVLLLLTISQHGCILSPRSHSSIPAGPARMPHCSLPICRIREFSVILDVSFSSESLNPEGFSFKCPCVPSFPPRPDLASASDPGYTGPLLFPLALGTSA